MICLLTRRLSPVAAALIVACSTLQAMAGTTLTVAPAKVTLRGATAGQQVIVTANVDGNVKDVTAEATYRTAAPAVFDVSEQGLISAAGDGSGELIVEWNGSRATVPVSISDTAHPLPVDLERDVIPVLTRYGCNAGACHGKARGQNGFQLSLLGFDPDFDRDAMAIESSGRRIFPPDPRRSLMLMKPTGQAPHGGGKRLEPDGPEYNTILRWIESGAQRRLPESPALTRVEVTPQERALGKQERQQLIVTAHYEDGSTRDVTRLAQFQSSESGIAQVDESGLITATGIVGETAVMARYMGMIDICNVAAPLPGEVPSDVYAKLPRQNFIDDFIWKKLETLHVTPSAPAPDHRFLRRAYIDIIGRVPTADEARAFLEDTASDKRAKLVDMLLERPEYAEHWANKWADLLRPNPYRVGIKTTLNYDAWIRNSFRQNKPYDQFVRELVTAQGSTFHNGAVTLFRDRRTPDELTTIVSQLFLGIRLECAKCHHHPFEVWGQDDFYSFGAYFAQLGRKGRGLSPPISGSEEMVYHRGTGTVSHPLTGEELPPRPLFGEAPAIGEDEDPRRSLAAWMTSDENPFFPQVMVNRIWADMMGRGLVEPVDDLRATNPATNQPLLTALGEDFRKHGYDIKHVIRTIANSYAYALSSVPNERNLVDTRYYSRHYRQRLRAEVLLDAITAITGMPESYAAMPPGSRAKEIWTHRIDSLFLDAFGRPDPNQDPPCERTTDTTVVQALHLMNAESIYRKITSDNSRAAELANGPLKPEGIVQELYLLVYSRFPDDEELQVAAGFFEKDGITRRQATEDLLWALVNTPEFVFKD